VGQVCKSVTEGCVRTRLGVERDVWVGLGERDNDPGQGGKRELGPEKGAFGTVNWPEGVCEQWPDIAVGVRC
jgi:hypothetical protein